MRAPASILLFVVLSCSAPGNGASNSAGNGGASDHAEGGVTSGGGAGTGGLNAGGAGGNSGGVASAGAAAGAGGGMSCPLPLKDSGPLKIACVGDSITQGNGSTDYGTKSYPAELGILLGSDYQVGNFGHSGTSMVTQGGSAYTGTAEYIAAQDFAPDVVVIMLGTNDMNTSNLPYIDDYVGDYLEMIAVFRGLPSHPVVLLGVPPWVKTDQASWGYTEARLTGEIIPRIHEVAEQSSACLIDFHAVTEGKSELYFDDLHPNDEGYAVLAATAKETLL